MTIENGKYLGTVKVGEKGQIVIPKEVREMFGISSGDTLILLADVEKGIALPFGDDLKKIKESVFGK